MGDRTAPWCTGLLTLAVLAGGCTSGSGEPAPSGPGSSTAAPPSVFAPASAPTPPTPTPPTPATTPATATPAPTRTATPSPPPDPRVDAGAVLRDIRYLAGEIGPREATSKNFREAADFVQRRFERLGYTVHRTTVRVPAGNSWGTPVRAGRSANLIADPAGFDAKKPHLVVGAHLDTVPVAPGAEDNASGVAVMLELARLAAATGAEPGRTELPVRFVAFGAEEPRGSGDALHHFGSTQLVAKLTAAERRAIRGMVALDRVGVRAPYVPVCTPPGGEGRDLQRAVRAAGRRVDVPTRACANNTASDHWSYAKAGISAIRMGSVPYAGYHSRADVPTVVDRRQLGRVTAVMWEWLGG